MKTIPSIALAALCSFVVPALAQGTPGDKLEIAGVRIGMTEAEATAALKAFDATLRIAPVMGVFNYSDGANPSLKSPEFLDRLEGSLGNQGAVLTVFFSGPVGDVRVIGVSRQGLIIQNPPTSAQFTQSLLAKYGQPSGMSRGNKSHPVWEAAGQPSCIRGRDYKSQVVIDLAAGFGASMITNSSAEDFLAKRSASTTAKGLIPPELANCGAYLGYYYSGDPVTSFSAELIDLGALVATERSRTAWVEQLQTEAVRKREGQGQTPKF
jgi:hypothetical protein